MPTRPRPPAEGAGYETVSEVECKKVEEVCGVMCAEKIYGAREVVDVKKVDYNSHLVRCFKKTYASGRGGSLVPRLCSQKPCIFDERAWERG